MAQQPNRHYREHLSTASDARAVRTRAALRRALLELLEKRPIEQISIRDIAEQADIGYATFYRHHPTKEALLDDLAAEEIRHVVGLTMPVMDAKSARAGSETLCAYVDEHRRLWSTFLTGGAASALRNAFLDVSLGIARERSHFAEWSSAELATRLIVGGTIEVLTWWMRQARPVSVRQAADLHLRMVIRPAVRSSTSGRITDLREPLAARTKRRRDRV